jgi:hypothetical protein
MGCDNTDYYDGIFILLSFLMLFACYASLYSSLLLSSYADTQNFLTLYQQWLLYAAF